MTTYHQEDSSHTGNGDSAHTGNAGTTHTGSEDPSLSLMPVIGFDMGGTSTDVSRYAGEYEHIFESNIAGVCIQAPQVCRKMIVDQSLRPYLETLPNNVLQL